MTLKGIPHPKNNLAIILSISSRFLKFQIVCNFGCVKSMTLLVNVSIFLLLNSFYFKSFATYSFNGCKVFCEITKHNSMLFEVFKKCSLILVIDVALNPFAQNLHFSSQELPCFANGVTH